MWRRDLVDIVIVVSWVGVWSALVYFVPIGGI